MKRSAILIMALTLFQGTAWAQSRVRAGCEAIAKAYEQQAIDSFKNAERISKWLADGENAALCSFYTVDYPDVQAAYIAKIQGLKKKGVCWEKDDQVSLERNLNALAESVKFRQEYCANTGTK